MDATPEDILRAHGETAERFTGSRQDDGSDLFDPTTLQGVPVPPRQWLVQDWLPVGVVTLAYGDGGVGKTLLAQQLMTSCATGKPWCGLAVQRCRAIGFFCEDSRDELHRRQDDINQDLGIEFSDLADFKWMCGIGEDNLLMRFGRDNVAQLTDRYERLVRDVRRFGARLVVIDNAANVFGGNENDRAQVQQFVGWALNRLARDINGVVLLNAHPSRAGLSATGDLDGGSTAWNNSARSRWSLARPKSEDGDERDTDARVLTRRKANYAAKGEEIKLRWSRGVLLPRARQTSLEFASEVEAIERLFLEMLDRCNDANMHLSASKNASNYAPKLFTRRSDARGHTLRDFEGAMQRLLDQKRIALIEYGRAGDERRRLARAETSNA